MTPCDCAQGSEENGWHEVIGPNCYEEELQGWRAAMNVTKTPEFQEMLESFKERD